MDIPTSLATSRLMAQERMMEVTANNLANASTPGFQASRMQFSDFIDKGAGVDAAPGVASVTYAQDRATWRETRAGSMTHTGNTFDLAITGEGYFTVGTKAGPRLTRDGRFGPMPDGTLADSSGNPVLGTTGQPIQIPQSATSVVIAGDGTVTTDDGQVGKIGVVRPTDPNAMQAEGQTSMASGSPTVPVAAPGIVQGAMEDSNVQPIMELTRMMDNERQFQLVSQIVQAEGDRQQSAIDKLLPASSGG